MANVGSADRIARVILGAGLLAAALLPALGLFGPEWGVLRGLVALAGAVMLVTAAVRFCPAYRLLGINTCRIGKP